MKPTPPATLLAQAAGWEDLTRWERAELGCALRRLGWSYGEIIELIPVPKGTLSNWCRDIRLSADQVAAIKARTGSRVGVPRDTQRKRRTEIERIQSEARAEVATLVGDPFWVAGSLLYWGEGDKRHRHLSMTNSDSDLLRLFIAWVRKYLQQTRSSCFLCTSTRAMTSQPPRSTGERRLVSPTPSSGRPTSSHGVPAKDATTWRTECAACSPGGGPTHGSGR